MLSNFARYPAAVMNKEKVAKILEDKVGDAREAAAALAPGFDEMAIHAFRVAVKKLRAFMRLVVTDEDQDKLKLSKKFHTLYDIAGEIRDAQLKLKKTKGQKSKLSGYVADLQHTIETNKEAWDKRYKPKSIDQFAGKLKDAELHKLSSKTLVLFVKRKMEVLEHAADNSPDDELIHECRKSVKDMLYNARVAEKHWPKAYKKIAHLPLKNLDGLADLLGNYNDERLMLASHISYIPNAKTTVEKSALSKLVEKEIEQKAEQRQVLLKEIQKFVTAAAI